MHILAFCIINIVNQHTPYNGLPSKRLTTMYVGHITLHVEDNSLPSSLVMCPMRYCIQLVCIGGVKVVQPQNSVTNYREYGSRAVPVYNLCDWIWF